MKLVATLCVMFVFGLFLVLMFPASLHTAFHIGDHGVSWSALFVLGVGVLTWKGIK